MPREEYKGIRVVFYADISEEEAKKFFSIPPQYRQNLSFLREFLDEVIHVSEVRIAKRTVTTV